MGKHEVGYARVERDNYPTSELWPVEALAAHVNLSGKTVWEMACGGGDMVRSLQAIGCHVFASDIVSYGQHQDVVHDFLSPTMPAGLPAIDALITNPPFGPRGRLATEFIEIGLKYVLERNALLALLLPTDFDAAKTRRHLFGGWLTKRCVWFPRTDGKREAPKENTSWYVWQAHDGPPVLLYGPNELRTLSTKPGSTGSS
jgi:hypothetical protein